MTSEEELLLLRRIAIEVSELTMGQPLSLRLTGAFADYAKLKEQEGRDWLDKMRKAYRKRLPR